MKKFFINKRLEKQINDRVFPDNPDLKTVGIIVHNTEFKDTSAFNSLKELLSLEDRELKVISYQKREKKQEPAEGFFCEKDLNLRGEWQSVTVKEFISREYDLLIGYYTLDTKYLDYIVSGVRANLKAGLDGSGRRIYDLVFKIESDQYSLFEIELIKYLKTIQNYKIG